MIKGKTHDLGEDHALPWPYPLRYKQKTKMKCDVLVLGGGLGGSRAAIAAAKEGASVIVVDKAPIRRSGSGGVGHDHWIGAVTNPASKITPEQFVACGGHNWLMGPMRYIMPKTAWDTLAELEEMGLVIRDVEDEFAGAPFRDEESKLLFCYDYVNKHSIRLIGGNYHKPTLDKEIDRLGITKVERVMATKLLYCDVNGRRHVNGAVGIHTQTGEMFVFEAKTVIVATGTSYGMWNYRNDVLGAPSEFGDPNNAGEGFSMVWEIGGQFALMERAGTKGTGGHLNGQPAYGGASCYNTHYPCSIVDAHGKEIPWVDHEGNIIKTVEERSIPREGQPYIIDGGSNHNTDEYTLIPDIAERIRKGEYKLPFYMDLPGMPKYERRAIWGLMVGNEGKSLYPIYNKYSQAGFDPDKDMLQANMMAPELYGHPGAGFWDGDPAAKDRDSGNFSGAGGFTTDWNLESTNIDGLFGAGFPIGAGSAAPASSSGRYAGRKAANKAAGMEQYPLDQKQIDDEEQRLYAALDRKDATIGWRELQAGLTRIMRDYLSDFKTTETIDVGKFWLKSLRETENQQVYVRNPHELSRYLEVQARMTVAEMYFEACQKRIEHDGREFFDVFHSPWDDTASYGDLQVLRKTDDGKIEAEYWDPRYELQEPYAPTFSENFYHFNPDYDEKYKAKEGSEWKTLRQY